MFAKSLKKYFTKYSDMLEKKPIKTKTITAAGLYVTGDVIGQHFFLPSGVDMNKTICGTLVTCGITAVTHHYYSYLNIAIQSGKIISQSASKIRQVLTTLSIDQCIFQPMFNSVFLVGLVALTERNYEKGVTAWKDRFVETQKTSYCLWPAIQFFNYYYIPLQYRILFMNGFGVVWNSLRTVLLNRKKEEVKLSESESCEYQTAHAAQSIVTNIVEELEDNVNYQLMDHASYYLNNQHSYHGNHY